MAEKHRIAVVGLGMALKPHLQSLRELSGRVEIAACHTPSEERREAFGRDNPDLSITDSLERVLADRSIRSVVLLDAADDAPGPRPALRRRRQARAPGKAARGHGRARPASGRGDGEGRPSPRHRAAAPFPRRLAAARRADARRRARRACVGLGLYSLVARARIFRAAGPGHEGARRRRGAPDPGDSHARPVPEPDRPDRPRRRVRQDLAAAPDRYRGHRLCGDRVPKRRRRRDRRHHGVVPGLSRAHRARLRERDGGAVGRDPGGVLEGRPRRAHRGLERRRRRRRPDGLFARGPQGADHRLPRRGRGQPRPRRQRPRGAQGPPR